MDMNLVIGAGILAEEGVEEGFSVGCLVQDMMATSNRRAFGQLIIRNY
jgi:hypothetical protein